MKCNIKDRHLNDFDELVFSFIGFQQVDREIDTNELEIIKRFIQSQNECENGLLIHVEEQKKLFIYYMKENEDEIMEIKERLESNYFFTVENQLLEHPLDQTQAISLYKRVILIERLNHFMKKKKNHVKIVSIEQDPSIICLSGFDKHKFDDLKEVISKLCNENVYYMKVITDMKLQDASDLQSSFMKKFDENNWNIFVSHKDLRDDESIKKMIKSESFTSLDFIGNNADIYHFFKTYKPKDLFITNGIYLFFEREDQIQKALEKLVFQYKIPIMNEKEFDSLFIDLTKFDCTDRFVCLKTLLKYHGKTNALSSYEDENVNLSTPNKKFETDYSTSCSDKKNMRKQPLENDLNLKPIVKNLFKEEEEKNEKGSLDFNQEKFNENDLIDDIHLKGFLIFLFEFFIFIFF